MLKESITQPLSSFLPSASTFEDDAGDSWPEQTDREEYDEDIYEQEKPSWRTNSKVESYNLPNLNDQVKKTNVQAKSKEPPKSEMKYSNPDDDLSALLKVKITELTLTKNINREPKLDVGIVDLHCVHLGRGRSCPCSPETSGGDNGHCSRGLC